MLSKINKKTVIIVVVSSILLLAPYAVMAFAAVGNSDTSNCTAFKAQFGGLFDWVDCASYANGNLLIYKIIQLLLGLAGGVAVLFVIIGGFWYVTSAGNEEQAEKGRKTLTNSIIGLVVIILAATIIRIVVNTVTGGATGSSSSSSNTTNSSNTASNNTTNTGNTNPSNQPTGGNDATDIEGMVGAVTMEPTQPLQGQNINFTVSFPASNFAQIQAACGGGSATFLAQLVNSGVTKSSNFSLTGSNYFASVTFPASSVTATNETANFAICNTGLPSQQMNFQIGQNFQPVN